MTKKYAIPKEPATIQDNDLTLLEERIGSLSRQLSELHDDILFIKRVFVEKQAKKDKRRHKREQKRLAIEKEHQAQEWRSAYEDIVWKLKHNAHYFMPPPASALRPKERELASLLARQKTDEEISAQMAIKTGSVCARISAACSRLGLKDREDLLAHYLEYQDTFRKHRRNRSLIILSWLLDPPPGFIRYRNLKAGWKRVLGKGGEFKRAEPHVSARHFDSLREYERRVLHFKLQGLTNAAIAEKLKIKESTVANYLGEIRSHIKISARAAITLDGLLRRYKEYLARRKQRK